MTEIGEDRRHALDVFWQAMLDKLNRPGNVAKSDWRGMEPAELVGLLEDELDELVRAVEDGDEDGAAEECLDVANFAFMVADVIAARGLQEDGP